MIDKKHSSRSIRALGAIPSAGSLARSQCSLLIRHPRSLRNLDSDEQTNNQPNRPESTYLMLALCSHFPADNSEQFHFSRYLIWLDNDNRLSSIMRFQFGHRSLSVHFVCLNRLDFHLSFNWLESNWTGLEWTEQSASKQNSSLLETWSSSSFIIILRVSLDFHSPFNYLGILDVFLFKIWKTHFVVSWTWIHCAVLWEMRWWTERRAGAHVKLRTQEIWYEFDLLNESHSIRMNENEH